MDVKDAIAAAKKSIETIYVDEGVSNLGLEEVEYDPSTEQWNITVAFSRPWNTPRTRAQEVLESIGGSSGLKRSYKVVALDSAGRFLSLKNYARPGVVD